MICPAIVIGYIADLIFGDPHGIWHPVCLIGNMITVFEKVLRRMFPGTKRGKLAAGVFLVIAVLFCSTAIPFAVLLICFRIHALLGFSVECYMCYTILATKSLKREQMAKAIMIQGTMSNAGKTLQQTGDRSRPCHGYRRGG